MALTLMAVWGHTPRPWGCEVRVDFTDEAGGIHNEVLTFEKEPDAAALEDAVKAHQSLVEDRLALEATMPLPETPETLKARVVELEAQVAVIAMEKEALVVEREALVMERDTLVALRDTGLVAEPDTAALEEAVEARRVTLTAELEADAADAALRAEG